MYFVQNRSTFCGDFWNQCSEERVRVAHSLQSWRCTQATRVQAPIDEKKIRLLLRFDLRFYLYLRILGTP